MKYHFHRDTLLATIFLFLVLWLLSVTIHTSIMEPGKIEPYDFDYTDIVYSESGPNTERFDPNIVIVNVGDTNRAGIAAILQKVGSMHPAAIGMDLVFHGNRKGDTALAAAIAAVPNLVVCAEKDGEGEKETGHFESLARHIGYGNFYGKKGNVIRYCLPFHGHDTSFAAAIAAIAAPGAFSSLCRINKEVQAINYTRRDSEYLVIGYHSLLNGGIDEDALKNKIVLIGFYSRDPNNIEDKMITPKNLVFLGRSLPDMHGVVIHANILSMILAGNYIYSLPAWLCYLFAILMGWACTGVFIKYIANKHIWFHIVVKLWQSMALFVLLALNVLLFKYCRIKADLSLTIVVLIFSAEVLYMYEMLALWLARKFNHKTVFKPH